jgi:hypothetical protein
MKPKIDALRQNAPDTKPGKAYGYLWRKATFRKAEYCVAGFARKPPRIRVWSAGCIVPYSRLFDSLRLTEGRSQEEPDISMILVSE